MQAKDDPWDNGSNRLNFPVSLAHDSGSRLRLVADPLHNHGLFEFASGLIPFPSEQCLLNVFPKFSSRS
jgi:hypothetical protein